MEVVTSPPDRRRDAGVVAEHESTVPTWRGVRPCCACELGLGAAVRLRVRAGAMDELTRSIRRSVWHGWGDPAEAHPLSAGRVVDARVARHRARPEVTAGRARGGRAARRSPSATRSWLRCVRSSVTASCTPIAGGGSSTRGARATPTCGGCGAATGRRRPTPSSSRPTRGRCSGCSRCAAPTASRSCPSVVARASSAAWEPPRGGGAAFAGVVAVDLRRLDQLLHVDQESRLATFQPGLRGPDIEQRSSRTA